MWGAIATTIYWFYHYPPTLRGSFIFISSMVFFTCLLKTYCWTVGERADRCWPLSLSGPSSPKTQAFGELWADMSGTLDPNSQPALNRLITLTKFAWFVYTVHININKRGHPWEGKSQTSIIITCMTDLGKQSCLGHPGQWKGKDTGLGIHLSGVLQRFWGRLARERCHPLQTAF